jgi:L-ascorbate metabolism protein UlaG (beta-lactamase superfamily)
VFSLLAVGGPTALLELGGLRLLTDPTFDPPGSYPRPGGYALVKTTPPALSPHELGPVDAVLLSHDHHPDNLDDAGRVELQRAPRVFTTVAGAARLGGTALGLPPWSSVALPRGDETVLTITAVPAQHGPDGTDHLTGPVVGFHLSGPDLPTVYVSGDNASPAVVQRVVERLGTVDVAVLFAGAARAPGIDGPLTLTGPTAARAAELLEAKAVVPVHVEGWEHFSQGVDEVRAAFAEAGLTDRLHVAAPGQTVSV